MKTLHLSLIALLVFGFTACNPETDSDKDEPDIPKTDTETPEEKPTTPEEEPVVEASITYGIDISKYQGNQMSLLTKENDSLEFVICRSTEGVTYTDPDFYDNWKLCKEKGFIRGAYHFYLSSDSPESQANNFLRVIKDLDDNDLPPIIDFEEESIEKGSDKEKVIEDLWKFIFIIEKQTGRMPIIYTDVNIGNEYLTAARFANYALWIANYTSAESPTMPGAWEGMKWVMWQKSDKYVVGNTIDDFDAFNGSTDDLKAFIASTILK